MIGRWRERLQRMEDALLSGLVLLLIGLSVAQIGQRELFDSGWSWAEPATRTLVLWLAMLGALAATRDRRHIAIDALPRVLPEVWRRVAWCVSQGFTAIVCAALAWYCGRMLMMEWEAPVPLFGPVPSWVGMLVLPFGFALMAVRFAISALESPPRLVAER